MQSKYVGGKWLKNFMVNEFKDPGIQGMGTENIRQIIYGCLSQSNVKSQRRRIMYMSLKIF